MKGPISQAHTFANQAMLDQNKDIPYLLKYVVGINTSSLWVASVGVRGANNLVWVGRAANHAAKNLLFFARLSDSNC